MLYFWKNDNVLKKLFYLLIIPIAATIGFQACEKDDICAENTPTTPHLIIRFYDLADTEEFKNVSGLFAYGLDDNNNAIPLENIIVSSTDSIVIPLLTDMVSTRFVLHKDYGIDNNGTPDDETDDILLGNPEIITLNYEPEDVYVSRACGFKTVFNTIIFNVTIDGDNWILNSEVSNTTVENENAAHVKVFH